MYIYSRSSTADHHYVVPRQAKRDLIDTEIKALEEVGIRFHATRGSMSLGVDDRGLPPQSVVQKKWEILLKVCIIQIVFQ